MGLFAIADLHFSFSADKPMDIFGENWKNHSERIIENWRAVVGAGDTVLLPGDLSWGMRMEDAAADLDVIYGLPGRKILLGGNHDYWWTTATKLNRFCAEKEIKTLEILHNNCVFYGDYAICGTRGWFLEEDQKPHNAKVLAREVGRLEMSLQAAGEKPILCFLHYPPLYQGYECPEILEVLKKYDVRQCCYGHLHGPTIRRRLEGKRGDIEYSLISADYLGFIPKKICE